MNLKQCDNFNYSADQYAVQYLYEKETITGKQFMEIYHQCQAEEAGEQNANQTTDKDADKSETDRQC